MMTNNKISKINIINIRKYDKLNSNDYNGIIKLAEEEKWESFYQERKEEYKKALEISITYVMYMDEKVIGFIRALSDGEFTLFIAEIIIDKDYRKNGYGKQLINYVHNLYPKTRIDLLSDNDDFYKALGFHSLGNGMRKCDWY